MGKLSRAANEKRMAQRIEIPIQVKYKYLPHMGALEEAIAQNISGSGIRLKLPHPLKKGDRLKILLYFPSDRQSVTALSEVVWCRKVSQEKVAYYDLGIRYIRIAPKDRERFIFRFCEMMINVLTLGKVR